jgi:hypothetical protein
VPNGDGILLDGRTLYVVRRRRGEDRARTEPPERTRRPAHLEPWQPRLPDDDRGAGSRLYAVNARFDFPSPNASTPYWVTKLSK